MANSLENLPKIPISAPEIKKLPEGAGVYVFFAGKYPIYVGKALNLRRRVNSYFDINLEPKTAKMVATADSLATVEVTSELEALLLEAKLIRKYMPRYNIAAKDDKHPLYIRISKETYPRVLTSRKVSESEPNIAFYGPFPSSSSVRSVLRMLRKIFPYSDHKVGKRGCLYSHIGLCNPCPNLIEQLTINGQQLTLRKQYLKNIMRIKSVLSGKFNGVKRDLAEEMEKASKTLKYEGAAKIRDQIKRIEYITQPQIPIEYFLENPNLVYELREKEGKELTTVLKLYFPSLKQIHRIECFDVAHLAGTKPTASMVTFLNAEPDKNYYRYFKINQKKGGSDTDSMKELINRRKKHFNDWGKPDLIIVDGGKPQVGVFIKELAGANIPVVGLAKRFETLVIPTKALGSTLLKELRLPRGRSLYLVQRIRNEAHRFARRYHHKLISMEIANENSN